MKRENIEKAFDLHTELGDLEYFLENTKEIENSENYVNNNPTLLKKVVVLIGIENFNALVRGKCEILRKQLEEL